MDKNRVLYRELYADRVIAEIPFLKRIKKLFAIIILTLVYRTGLKIISLFGIKKPETGFTGSYVVPKIDGIYLEAQQIISSEAALLIYMNLDMWATQQTFLGRIFRRASVSMVRD
jgi:hypothetical protein